MIVHGRTPFNAEPTLDHLRTSFFTPAAQFYVRCHGAIPRLDAASHRVTIDGDVDHPLDLGMDELRALAPARDVDAVLQCAGNRRADLQHVAPTTGDPWSAGAIGHARWTGIPLSTVLRAAGAASAAHVAFESADHVDIDGERSRFGVSIPMSKALSDEVLLAWAMNGQPLAPEHGYPLRLVVPGYAGVRSPKWLTAMTVQHRPSDNHMQARDYRLLPPHVTPETVERVQGLVIDEMPINAAICEPERHARVAPGSNRIRGYAIASGRAIARVDVSIDGGRTWQQAELEHGGAWSWTFWNRQVDIPPGEHELAVRAWDSAGQTQPARAEEVWNFKGYLSAAWHRVPIKAG